MALARKDGIVYTASFDGKIIGWNWQVRSRFLLIPPGDFHIKYTLLVFRRLPMAVFLRPKLGFGVSKLGRPFHQRTPGG
jgi:hypothetical protein